MFKLKSFEELYTSSLESFKRFPAALICSFAAFIVSYVSAEFSIDIVELKYFFTFLLGLPLYFSSELFLDSRGLKNLKARILGFVVSTLILCIFYIITLNDYSFTFWYWFFCLGLVFHLFVSFAPFKFSLEEEKYFWQFNRTLFLRILLSGLYSGVFFLGVSIAFILINKLFSVHFQDKTYSQLWFFSLFVLQTWHFLSGVPKNFREEINYPAGLKLFVQYLLIPLVSFYFLIVYCYGLKTIMMWTWPRGYIGWLVSFLSILGIFNLLLVYPEKDNPNMKWVSTYVKWYYKLILAPLILLFVALGKRISDYGITENRYVLLVSGLLLFSLSIYFLFNKKKNIQIIPRSLAFVALLSLLWPVSAKNISLQSQLRRWAVLMEKNHLIQDSKLIPAEEGAVSASDASELRKILKYIIKNHGTKPLDDWYSETTLAKTINSNRKFSRRYVNVDSLMQEMHLLGVDYGNQAQRTSYYSSRKKDLLDISGYNHMVEFHVSRKYSHHFLYDKITLKTDKDAVGIVSDGKEKIRFSLKGMIDNLQKIRESGKKASKKDFTVMNENQDIKVKFIFKNIGIERNDTSFEINELSGILLIENLDFLKSK